MNKDQVKAQLTVWWMVWSAFQVGVLVYPHFLAVGTRQPQAGAADSLPWLICLVPLTISTLLRWTILPRIQNPQVAVQLFIVGIAMSESVCFLGLYRFPVYQKVLFMWSVLGIFQFMPYFATRYFPLDDTRTQT
jgi:hypothetical protein